MGKSGGQTISPKIHRDATARRACIDAEEIPTKVLFQTLSRTRYGIDSGIKGYVLSIRQSLSLFRKTTKILIGGDLNLNSIPRW